MAVDIRVPCGAGELPPSVDIGQATLLPLTKLRPPRVRPDAVVRPRLLDAMRRALETANLVLISAPPGSGKTTLLASAAALCTTHNIAWLALDEDDNAVCFLRSLIAAIEHALP